MLNLGLMSLHLSSEKGYFDEIAKRGIQYGIVCLRFVPSAINPTTMLVKGEKYDHERNVWLQAEFPVPSIIYDRCFYGDDGHSKQCMPIVSWLKNREDISFLGYGLPNKLELYEVLKRSGLSPYLPPSKSVDSPEEVLKELRKLRRILIKPVNGSQGNGIYFMEKNRHDIVVKTDKQKQQIIRSFTNETQNMKWLAELIKKKKYLVQPYLELTDSESCPFDIRVLMQKTGEGQWIERGKGIRTGKKNGIISNLSAGGSVTDFETWIGSMEEKLQDYLQAELNDILSNIPVILEEAFLPLFELGIDIGIDKNRAIWILDINSKPGRKVILATRPELKENLYRAPLQSALAIGKSDQKERKRHYENTLSH